MKMRRKISKRFTAEIRIQVLVSNRGKKCDFIIQFYFHSRQEKAFQ